MRTLCYIFFLLTSATGLLLASTTPQPPSAYQIFTVAGSDDAGDGSAGTSAQLGSVEGLALDSAGNLYIADARDHRVRKLSTSGAITTVAGNGHPGFAGDGGPATAALLSSPYGLAIDSSGNLYIADRGNGRVRKVTPGGVISTIAGGGPNQSSPGSSGDALSARLVPRNLAVNNAGEVHVSDFNDHRVYRISTSGFISSVAGTGVSSYSGDGGPAISAGLQNPAGLAVDRHGALYIADSGGNRIRKVFNGIISTVLTVNPADSSDTPLSVPTGLAVDSYGALYVADSGNARIRKLFPGGFISTAVAKETVAISGAKFSLASVRDVAADASGNIYIADGARVLKYSGAGGIGCIAGDGSWSYRGDNGPAIAARLDSPFGLAFDPAGVLYISDQGNRRVRAISSAGTITTVAGPGNPGTLGDQGRATSAYLAAPAGMAADSAGNVYVADFQNHRVRRISPSGAIQTVAGTGQPGVRGDGGPATTAELNHPLGLATDPQGNLYIADSTNHRVRKLTPDGLLFTVAGRGVKGYGGDGGAAVLAQFDTPKALALDMEGNLYVADAGNHCVRKVTPFGTITTIAGAGLRGSGTDGSPASLNVLDSPGAVAVDSWGRLFIADTGNHRVVMLLDGSLQSVAGMGVPGFSGDGGPARAARLDMPSGITFDREGNLFIADHQNRRVRKLTPSRVVTPEPLSAVTIVNAASLREGPVAPGELISIFLAGSNGAGDVMFDGEPAPVSFASDVQINTQVPYSVRGRTQSELRILQNGSLRVTTPLTIVEAAPALFNVALNEDGSLNSPTTPARRGSIVLLFATGEGAGGLPVALRIGAWEAELLFAGPAPGFSGLFQINARIPAGYAGVGIMPVELKVGEFSAPPGLTIHVE